MEDNNSSPQTVEELQRQVAALQKTLDDAKDKGPVINEIYNVPTNVLQNRAWGTFGVNSPKNFELKPSLISLVQAEQFSGRGIDDAHSHLTTFLDFCDTIKMNGVPEDVIRLRLFGFSLRDRAKDWYQTLDRTKITTWSLMSRAFLAKYFPLSKALRIIFEITHFSQSSNESIHEAYERFKDLLRKCPQHGFSLEQQVTTFYSGLHQGTKIMVDASAGGCLMNRTATVAMRIIEEMADTSSQWYTDKYPISRSAAVINTRYEDLMAEIALLKKQAVKDWRREVNMVQQQYDDGEFIADNNFVQNRNLGEGIFARGPSNLEEPREPTMKELLSQVIQGQSAMAEEQKKMAEEQKSFMSHITSKINHIESNCSAMQKHISILEAQMGQMGNQSAANHMHSGPFPKQHH